MIEWMGRQTAIGATKKRYVGRTQSERDLLKQFVPERRKQGGAEIKQENVETSNIITSQVMPDQSTENIDQLYAAEVNEIGNDSEEADAYEREINRIQHFDEVVLPGLITVVSTIIFFFAFTIILSPHIQ